MEHCKIHGESLRNQDGGMEIKINELPDDSILHILSFLPTKNVIATSVLCKRWQSLWKMVPKLEFGSRNMNKNKFSENVISTLISHKAPVLQSLHLKDRDNHNNPIDIRKWVGIALTRHIRELVIDFLLGCGFNFPSNLFSSNTLETLKLGCHIHVDVPSSVCMKSLRTMHLNFVVFNDDESFCNLISGCPILQDLVLVYLGTNNNGTFNIVAPSLKTLSIHDYYKASFVMKTPSLKYLKIKGGSSLKCSFVENVPMVVEANINFENLGIDTIWGSLKSVKRLSLELSYLKYPTSHIFYELVDLEIETTTIEWWNLLTFMLDFSPKLQVLKLIDSRPRGKYLSSEKYYKKNVGEWDWIQPKHVPKCLLSHLETFVWNIYDWKIENEKKVAIYILKNARQLKKATFYVRPVLLGQLKERRKMLRKLDDVVGASDSCHLVFKDINSNDSIPY